ncbi:MAG: ATP synthase F0 subunit A [Deltaproteobacteria bacterium]|nr:MAG: ATP synthase F0 subunit A [Deltaproteobacteria bacterium]
MRKAILGLLLLAALPATALAAGGGGHGFSWFMMLPGGEHYFYVYSAFFIAAFLVAGSLLVVGSRKTSEMVVPDPRFTLRNLFELILGFLSQLAEDIIGHHYRKYLPLLGSCFLFILFMNLLGLIPGFLPPTQKMNITVGLALVIFLSTHYFGVRENGIAYFKHFLGPVWWMAPIMLPIEIISHLARPMSLSLRLFGNITGDHAVVAGFMALIPIVVPSVFMGLGLFVSFMQAFIFTVLSMIYISGAVAHGEEH